MSNNYNVKHVYTTLTKTTSVASFTIFNYPFTFKFIDRVDDDNNVVVDVLVDDKVINHLNYFTKGVVRRYLNGILFKILKDLVDDESHASIKYYIAKCVNEVVVLLFNHLANLDKPFSVSNFKIYKVLNVMHILFTTKSDVVKEYILTREDENYKLTTVLEDKTFIYPLTYTTIDIIKALVLTIVDTNTLDNGIILECLHDADIPYPTGLIDYLHEIKKG